MRVAADLPAAERPRLEVEDPRGAAFQRRLAETRRARGADFSICDLEVRTRPAP
ncbi:hypothetical protein [Phenylobacterium sp. J367]|uniref:hypothetical protein n=1 Tax=Phenylobacterium sp. J367 TaxID=2898435 RepID=UPI002150A6A2|nr:hypothetical protein [Phenylobacterium sp. J367]MCR5878940.1 hypothetical protein [Phenylobacterium sp. J367]